MPKRIQFRRDTADNWAFHNPRLMPGEIGMETDTQKFKIGDGDLDWEDLPYYLSLAAQEGALDEAVDQAVLDATTLASGFKDAAAGSAAAADVSADAAASSAIAAEASAGEAAVSAASAEAAADTTDELVSDLVDDTGSATHASIVALSGSGIEAMNTATRDALGTVPDGTTIYNTTAERLETYSAPVWVGALSILETLGAAFTTWGADIDLGGGTFQNLVGYDKPSYARRSDFSASGPFDFTDGMGGASAGYGSMSAPCSLYEEYGPPIGAGASWAADEPTNLGITLSQAGLYLWTAKIVLKRNGGTAPNCEVYLRRNSSGTRTGGTGVMSVNLWFGRTDNIFSEQTISQVIELSAPTGDYHMVLTAGTSAANLSAVGYGLQWGLTRLGDR
jgi:Major tropism determinant N-terminal domain